MHRNHDHSSKKQVPPPNTHISTPIYPSLHQYNYTYCLVNYHTSNKFSTNAIFSLCTFCYFIIDEVFCRFCTELICHKEGGCQCYNLSMSAHCDVKVLKNNKNSTFLWLWHKQVLCWEQEEIFNSFLWWFLLSHTVEHIDIGLHGWVQPNFWENFVCW